MLDDLKYIHQRDGQDALGIAEKQWQQYQHEFEIDWPPSDWRPSGIVVLGMGGSAQAASALAANLDLNVPFNVVRDYKLPSYVNQNYLAVFSSYSGNTEETLNALDQALSKPESEGPRIICLSSGGKLAELAGQHNFTSIKIPIVNQPRFSFAYQLTALAQLFEKLGLTSGLAQDIKDGARAIESSVAAWRPDVATADNQAKKIAMELAGKSPVIYGGPLMFPAAYKWKINFNENAKNVAWCNQYSEFNHNEFIGWTSHPVDKTYGVVELRSQHEHPRITKRFELSDKLLSGRMPPPIVVDIPKSGSSIGDVMWAVALGDFVSIYMALINGVNPSPVDLVEKLKIELGS